MKKLLIVIAGLAISIAGSSQLYIHGSVQQGSTASKVDIVFRPAYTSAVGEYANFIQFGIAVPATGNTNLTATLAAVGNFTGLTGSFQPQTPYVFNGERIYNWICANAGAVTTMSWTAGTAFIGATITFTGGGGPAKVRLVDLTNQGGNNNTYYVIATSNGANDPVEYGNQFYSITGGNGSTVGLYGATGDRFAETNLQILLPVNLLNFSGYKNGGKNTLNWKVASEVNNRGFEVQRSTDGINYSSIGFVNSQAPGGFTNSEVSYTFDDNSPVGKKQYYRLNQQDIDGNSKLSNIVVINGDRPKILGIGGLFPNPAREKINVIIAAPQREKVTLVVTDITGKTVKQQLTNVETGSNTVAVDIASLASGSYVIKVLCKSLDCEAAVGKFNKQ